MAVRRKSARQRFVLEDANPSPTEWETPEPSVSYSKFRTKRLQELLEEINETLKSLNESFPHWRLSESRGDAPAHCVEIRRLEKDRERIILELTKRRKRNSDGRPDQPKTSEAKATDSSLQVKHTNRRAMVNAYIEEVRLKKCIRITRKDIWTEACYRSRTEFERWQRQDPKHPNKTADKNFARILREKPHLK